MSVGVGLAGCAARVFLRVFLVGRSRALCRAKTLPLGITGAGVVPAFRIRE
jgi:hypothetical protein